MRKGFTLAEVLVVIVILAIAASIMLPVFSRSRAKAKEVVCISNLREIYAAVELYRADHDGEYPRSSLHNDMEPYGLFRLRCPMSNNNPTGDYDVFCRSMANPGSPSYQRYQSCLEDRGSAIPISWDWNHFKGRSGSILPDGFELVLRANGAVNRIPRPRVEAAYLGIKLKRPCAIPELNL